MRKNASVRANELAPLPRSRLLMRAGLLLLGLSLVACSDEQRDSSRGATSGGSEAPHKVTWLDLDSPVTPAQWLVSRGEEKPRSLSDPEVQRVTRELKDAHALYRESQRMIANRAAQVSDMLAGIGITEPATEVLASLAGIAGEAGQTEGFGGVAQHYFNLRAASLARAEALEALKVHYGPRSKT